jgi:transposase-like protein
MRADSSMVELPRSTAATTFYRRSKEYARIGRYLTPECRSRSTELRYKGQAKFVASLFGIAA